MILSSNSSPIGPSITFCMCAVLRNRNGRLNTLSSWITGPSAPTLMRAMERADLRLLDRLFLAAELHRGEHLHGEPAVGRGVELLAEVFDRDHRRVAGGCTSDAFRTSFCWANAGMARPRRAAIAAPTRSCALHEFLPALPCCRRGLPVAADRRMLVIISYDDFTTQQCQDRQSARRSEHRPARGTAQPDARSHRTPERANHERRTRAGRAVADRAGIDRCNRGEPHGGARGGRGIARRRPRDHPAGRGRIRRRVRRAGRSASTAANSPRCIT